MDEQRQIRLNGFSVYLYDYEYYKSLYLDDGVHIDFYYDNSGKIFIKDTIIYWSKTGFILVQKSATYKRVKKFSKYFLKIDNQFDIFFTGRGSGIAIYFGEGSYMTSDGDFNNIF